MRRLRICFSAALLALTVVPMGNAATVSGTVKLAAAPEHAHGHTSGLADIVVWLQPEDGRVTMPVSTEHVRLLQKDKMFHPHVLPIRTGTVVDFPNADPIFHNAFSNYDGQLFDVGLYPPGTNRSVRFKRTGVVRVFCNIHSSMSAIILVLNSASFANVSGDGHYQIDNVRAGTYQVHVYDERATSGGGTPLLVSIKSDQNTAALPTINISERGYVRSAHKNKFGSDYAPDSDNAGYDGALK